MSISWHSSVRNKWRSKMKATPNCPAPTLSRYSVDSIDMPLTLMLYAITHKIYWGMRAPNICISWILGLPPEEWRGCCWIPVQGSADWGLHSHPMNLAMSTSLSWRAILDSYADRLISCSWHRGSGIGTTSCPSVSGMQSTHTATAWVIGLPFPEGSRFVFPGHWHSHSVTQSHTRGHMKRRQLKMPNAANWDFKRILKISYFWMPKIRFSWILNLRRSTLLIDGAWIYVSSIYCILCAHFPSVGHCRLHLPWPRGSRQPTASTVSSGPPEADITEWAVSGIVDALSWRFHIDSPLQCLQLAVLPFVVCVPALFRLIPSRQTIDWVRQK